MAHRTTECPFKHITGTKALFPCALATGTAGFETSMEISNWLNLEWTQVQANRPKRPYQGHVVQRPAALFT